MKYLGFKITRTSHVFLRWSAGRSSLKATVVIYAQSQKELKKYLRAIHVAERTGVIRKKRSTK